MEMVILKVVQGGIMCANKKEDNMTRQPYQKPQLEEVKLVAEEAVLTNCKSRDAGIVARGHYNRCSNPGGHQVCYTLGS